MRSSSSGGRPAARRWSTSWSPCPQVLTFTQLSLLIFTQLARRWSTSWSPCPQVCVCVCHGLPACLPVVCRSVCRVFLTVHGAGASSCYFGFDCCYFGVSLPPAHHVCVCVCVCVSVSCYFRVSLLPAHHNQRRLLVPRPRLLLQACAVPRHHSGLPLSPPPAPPLSFLSLSSRSALFLALPSFLLTARDLRRSLS